ncbi:unnamed protein product [Lactuca saligna]|uniref:Uncharacterized protein n=1 Tax=Lactuca saligna TaxID=75948 RepID=A0AA35YDX4_LACSI|nr:unnamed protein product [Lactuca saligna]
MEVSCQFEERKKVTDSIEYWISSRGEGQYLVILGTAAVRKEISDETNRETGRSKQISSVHIYISVSILLMVGLLGNDNIICNIRRQYTDTRTQANLWKLKSNHKQELHVHTEQMSLVVEWRRRSDMLERMMKAHKSAFPVWGFETLEK